MAGLILRNIQKSYGANQIIKDLNLEIEPGEFVTLLGPSGCGKTTLLRMIAGLEKIDNGELYIGGKLMNGLPPQKRPIGMVFQSYALFPHMNVRNNIAFGLRVQKMCDADIFQKLDWVLPLLRLQEYEYRLPRELSGGQRQRVALARSLVLDPEVLLLDEPLSNLDAALRELATEELKRIHLKVGKTVVYVTHNQMEAMVMSRRIAAMRKGNIEQYDSPTELYDNPSTLFTAKFIGSPVTNTIDGTIAFDGDEAYAETEIGRVNIYNHKVVDWKRYDGREVTICIRPQDIWLYDNKRGKTMQEGDTRIELKVEMVETPGDRSLVVGFLGDGEQFIRFFVNRQTNLKRGEKYKVVLPGNLLHIFDKKSEKNILAE